MSGKPNTASMLYERFGTRDLSNTNANRVQILQQMYMRVLTELSVNRFKWYGLPESVDPRFLELTLFYRCLSVFYYEPETGEYAALQASPVGGFNYMDNPKQFRTYGNDFPGRTMSNRVCVPIWGNNLRIPDLDIVQVYASDMADIHRTLQINTVNTRHNKVAVSNEDTRLSVRNILRQIQEGQQVVETNMDLDEVVQTIDLGIHPDLNMNTSILKARIWSEALAMMGINGSNQDKKERLVEAEVGANNEQVFAARAVSLNARKRAADEINRKFTELEISVEYNEDIDDTLATMVPSGMTLPGNTITPDEISALQGRNPR